MDVNVVLGFQVQKCCYLCIRFVPEGMVQVRFCARWNWGYAQLRVYLCLYVCVYV